MMQLRQLLSLAAMSVIIAGCSNQHLFFGTETSVGMNVSGSVQIPDSVSIAYKRTETAVVPKKSDGTAHSVFGKLDADLTLTDGRKIRQIFATGDAAILAAQGTSIAPPTQPTGGDTPPSSPEAKISSALVVATQTVFGIDLSAGSANLAPSFTLGYRRAEATLIPILDPSQEVRSVYADISIDNSDKTVPGATPAVDSQVSTMGGVRIVQSIATGQAAQAYVRAAGGTKLQEIVNGTKFNSDAADQRDSLEKAVLYEINKLPGTKQEELQNFATTQIETLKGVPPRPESVTIPDYFKKALFGLSSTTDLQLIKSKASQLQEG